MKSAHDKIAAGIHESIGIARALWVIDKWLKPSHVRLYAGEMTAQEMRTTIAVLKAVRAEIVAGKR